MRTGSFYVLYWDIPAYGVDDLAPRLSQPFKTKAQAEQAKANLLYGLGVWQADIIKKPYSKCYLEI